MNHVGGFVSLEWNDFRANSQAACEVPGMMHGCWGLLGLALLAASPGQDPAIDFTRDIQPLLRAQCLSCHGPRKAKGHLRLDSRVLALKGGLSGRAIVPGKSGESLLLRLLEETDEEARMPQKAAALPREKIELIRRWIDQGAAWPADAAEVKVEQHWAYGTPVRPEPPPVKNPEWTRNPVDRFILARLEREGLAPSAEAPPETLLRRLCLDLTGLPPSLEELDAYLADRSPDAYDRAVDRLLASPHYGERWAQPWLDLARYADSNGYERDGLRTMWKYRDWVIEALNVDMPFTQFTIEQIAGDLLPDPTVDQIVATGFHRNSMRNEEDGVDREEARWNTLVERVGTTATVWLGTTLACAQCHNHKFDPFSQKDFYRLLAFFENDEELEVEVPTPAQAAELERVRAEIERLQRTAPELDSARKEWERREEEVLSAWRVLDPIEMTATDGTILEKQPDGSVLARGPSPAQETYRIVARAPVAGITAFRLETLTDPSLPGSGPGRAHNGDFVLSEFNVLDVPLHKPTADFASKYAWIPLALDGKPETGWAIGPQVGRRQVAHFETRAPVAEAGLLTFVLEQRSPHPGHTLGRFRLSALAVANPSASLALPGAIRSILEAPGASRTELAAYYRTIAPALQPVRDRVAQLEKRIEALGVPRTWVLRERAGAPRRSTRVRLRGSYLAKGEEVHADVPAALDPKADRADRLGLARWLVDDRNPLAARVAVNRFWEQLFGRGIVETSEDFGTQGTRPVHPELLDWLATEFRRQNWSMKSVLRILVTSAAYRQSSRLTPALLERDPDNRLLARGPSFRLGAEAIRDVALAASGLLSRNVGGPSVFPPQPEGTWRIAASKEGERWATSVGEDRYRRGLYVFWRRSAPYPSFVTFDAPSREFCTARRPRTGTPLQALTLLNDPAFFEAARALGARMAGGAGDPARRIAFGFRLCVARSPEPEEGKALLELYEKTLRRGTEEIAWTAVANALLNLDETVTKD